jgi:glycosyltransferase involved in cell wall biosynthesis
MEHVPFVSIVIPVFNSGHLIGETIDSVLSQTFTNFEIIIVDDGSTDETPDILIALKKTDSRISVYQQLNGRQGKARNFGVSKAKANLIAFLDADDLWPPNKLIYQLEVMKNSSADLTFTNGYICLNNQMELRDHLFGVKDEFFFADEGVRLFHIQNRVPTSTVIVKREVFDLVGGFPETLNIQNCEDYYLWTKLVNSGFLLQGISKPLLYYRVHPESSTGQEIKLLFPLVRVLMQMPGVHGIELKAHLEEKFIRLLTVLNETKSLRALEELAIDVPLKIHGLFKGTVIGFFWKVSKRLYISMIWRLKK